MKYEEFGFHDKDITNIDKVIESMHELVGIKCDRYYTLLFSVLLIILITMVTVLIELVYSFLYDINQR
jgi:hypothetical protein